METWLIELAKQVPSLIVLAWLVFQHQTAIKEQRESFLTQQNSRDIAFTSAITNMAQQCHAVQKRSTTTLERSTRVLGRMEVVVEHAVDALLEHKIKGSDKLKKQSDTWNIEDNVSPNDSDEKA